MSHHQSYQNIPDYTYHMIFYLFFFACQCWHFSYIWLPYCPGQASSALFLTVLCCCCCCCCCFWGPTCNSQPCKILAYSESEVLGLPSSHTQLRLSWCGSGATKSSVFAKCSCCPVVLCLFSGDQSCVWQLFLSSIFKSTQACFKL